MDKLKYIVSESGDIAIFSPTATHQNVARTMMSKPIGAGFVSIDIKESSVYCHGESTSLNIKSRHVLDAAAILKAIIGE